MDKQEEEKKYKKNPINKKTRIYKDEMKKTFKIVFLFIFVGIFIFSTSRLLIRGVNNQKQEKLVKELKKEVVEKANDNSKDFNDVNIAALKEKNPDVLGYIEVIGTTISFPILQGDDNSYYLTKDITKKYNINGSIFMDYRNHSDFSDSNTVIFGHNMHNGNMFNPLQKIVKGELGKEIYINIYTEKYIMKYEVFSSYYNEPNGEPIEINLEDKQKFIDEVISKSNVEFGKKPSSEDNLITLSTCDMTGKKRTIVHAFRIILLEK